MRNIEPPLQAVLPSGYDYEVTLYSAGNNSDSFQAVVRVNLFSKNDAELWLSEFQKITKLEFRVLKTYPDRVQKIFFKKDYRCQHNTKAEFRHSKTITPSLKHTKCPAGLKITVKNYEMKRSKDKLLKTHPCEILIKHFHNHPVGIGEILRYRKPLQETIDKVHDLYLKGLTPSAALKIIKEDLQREYGTEYSTVASDGAVCPTQMWMYHYYYKNFGRPERLKAESKRKPLKEKTVIEENIKETGLAEFLKIEHDCESEVSSQQLSFTSVCPGSKKDYDFIEVLKAENVEEGDIDNIAYQEEENNIEGEEFEMEFLEEETVNEEETKREVEIVKEKAQNLFYNLNLDKPEALKAWQTFFHNFEQLESESDLYSALIAFGKR